MKRTQTGSVLSISLVLLTAITLIAMMTLQRSGLQTKIVANIQHDESAYNAALSEQEYWYGLYNTSASSSKLLFDVINEFDVAAGGAGVKEQQQLDLAASRQQSPLIQLQVASNNLYLPTSDNPEKINLAVGHDIGAYTNHHFQLDTTATFQNRPSIVSPQRTGFHFPALIIGQNSL